MSVGVAVLQGFAEKKLHLGPTSDPSHQVNNENTVEPPVSDHPNEKTWWSFTTKEPQGSRPRCPLTSTL